MELVWLRQTNNYPRMNTWWAFEEGEGGKLILNGPVNYFPPRKKARTVCGKRGQDPLFKLEDIRLSVPFNCTSKSERGSPLKKGIDGEMQSVLTFPFSDKGFFVCKSGQHEIVEMSYETVCRTDFCSADWNWKLAELQMSPGISRDVNKWDQKTFLTSQKLKSQDLSVLSLFSAVLYVGKKIGPNFQFGLLPYGTWHKMVLATKRIAEIRWNSDPLPS